MDTRVSSLKVKVKFTLEQATKAQKGGVDIYLYSFSNLGVRWKGVVNATPRPLYPRERLDTHCTGGWVGLRAGLDGCGKSRPTGFYPRTVQPVASRYTTTIFQPNNMFDIYVILRNSKTIFNTI